MPSKVLLELQILGLQVDAHVISTCDYSFATSFELDTIQVPIRHLGVSLLLGHALVPQKDDAVHVAGDELGALQVAVDPADRAFVAQLGLRAVRGPDVPHGDGFVAGAGQHQVRERDERQRVHVVDVAPQRVPADALLHVPDLDRLVHGAGPEEVAGPVELGVPHHLDVVFERVHALAVFAEVPDLGRAVRG